MILRYGKKFIVSFFKSSKAVVFWRLSKIWKSLKVFLRNSSCTVIFKIFLRATSSILIFLHKNLSFALKIINECYFSCLYFHAITQKTQDNYYHVFIMLTCNNFLSLNACVGVHDTQRQNVHN